MPSLTLKERAERERIILELIEEGLSQRQIAERIGITQQGISRFLKLRGWRTKHALEPDIDEIDHPVEDEREKNTTELPW